jgi:hypothetical protein
MQTGNPTLLRWGWIGRGPAVAGRKCRGKSAGVAWVVNFNNGNCNHNNVDINNNYVRAVRGG